MSAVAVLDAPTEATTTSTPVEHDDQRPARKLPGWLARNLTGPTLFVMSLGVLVMAAAANTGREGATGTGLDVAWIVGLILVYAPAAIRIVGGSTPALERVALAVGLGMVLQFSRLVLNPTSFVFHDEFIHAEVLRQIDETGRLFSFNPLLPVASYYPGLEIVTDAVQRLSGLPAFAAAAIVLMLARVIMVLAIIGIVRVVTGSYRAGAVGALVYIANPQLLFFNSQFSYQTLALPLSLLCIYLIAVRRRDGWASLILPMALTATVVITHHLTAALLIAAYAVWFALLGIRSRRAPADFSAEAIERNRMIVRTERRGLGILTAWGALLLAVTVFNPGNPLASYLGAILGSSGADLLGLAEGQNPKVLFSNSAGAGPAPIEQVLLISAVLIAMASLLLAIGYVRRSWRASRPFALLLGLVAILYPVVPGGHLTQATAEVGDRAAGFVFLGTAVVVGAWWWQRSRNWRVQIGFALVCTALFLGNVVLGAGPTAGQLPGPYQVSADARSVDADNVAAAEWQLAALPESSVVYADRTSGLLAAAIGGQETVMHVSTNIDASHLLLAPVFSNTDRALIRKTDLDYLVVDTRMSSSLPHQQVYIESGEYGLKGRTSPVSDSALEKFATIEGVNRIYDNGSLVIYDVRGLR